MAEPSNMITRRVVIAGALGGATVAGAMAAETLRTPLSQATQSFADAFTSPFFSFANADHLWWASEVGKLIEVAGGAVLRVSGVEAFAPFGEDGENLNRSRAFAVKFEIVNRVNVAGNLTHRMRHPEHGNFELFLLTSPAAPGKAQAIFN